MMVQSWYALRVKSRHEFVVSQELSRKGVDNFLPAVTRVQQWKDRKKVVDFPLFPGYVFVHLVPAPGEFLNVVKTRGSVSFVSLEPGHPTPVAPEEIGSLRVMLESGNPIDVFPSLREGTAVRVKRGPLVGAVGVLAQREDQHVFIVNIEILGRSVGLKIQADDVEQA
ncbi:MAG TPA: UpxY family transcription antiterminator [Nitrospirota bacterium]